MLWIDENVQIAEWELSEQFTRAQGPGGQNVNKVSSAVELRFEAERSPHLSPAVKRRLRKIAGRRWTAEGAIVLRAEESRSQARNRALARERLVAMVQQAMVPPKRRIPTRPTYSSKLRRLAAKTARAEVKAARAKVGPEE